MAATAPAAQTEARQQATEKTARMVDAARASIAEHGITGATFDQVARVAGVSRGLLHYYFGSKERLLVEVVRRECDVRNAALEQAIGAARSAEEVIEVLVHSFEDLLGEGPATVVMMHEMITLAQRNAGIAVEVAELGRRTRQQLADALQAKTHDGVLELKDGADAVAAFLFVLADGILVRRLSEPGYDIRPLVDKAVTAARTLL